MQTDHLFSMLHLEDGSMSNIDSCILSMRCCADIQRLIDRRLSLHGLSFGDFTILYHLQRAAKSRLRRIDLAEKMGLTASAVTRSLIALEKIGLVARQTEARDARVSYASLTPTGLALFNDAELTAAQACEEAIQSIVIPVKQSIEAKRS